MARPRTKHIAIGMTHGHLTVIREVEARNRSGPRYECLCECGNKTVIRSAHFYDWRRYCSNQCSLLALSRKGDLTGEQFKHWTVLRFDQIDAKSGMAMWLCRCVCGTERPLPGAYLKANRTKSCGCPVGRARKYPTIAEKKAAQRVRSRLSGRKHAARVKANKIKYETKRTHASPPWLSEAHWEEMNAFYAEARRLTRETGIRHEVDHCVPIQGKFVSGLHVPWNLQILTQADNVSKSNMYADLHGDM